MDGPGALPGTNPSTHSWLALRHISAPANRGAALTAAPAPVAFEFRVYTRALHGEEAAAAPLNADGDFVVVWDSGDRGGIDAERSSIQKQRYSASRYAG